ncbi:secondary thiamine-phosphate synthase enzyme YjbQ [Halanaerobium sp. Z-7514]|uniref:Secondary thiamine-phosphate synthase enzyme YjbQ n=1 Tax=Halanaerobium polyolivorans TaxID=2886943 RepID=A0AAW4X1Y9_9FIRM|nr:secondary thiamine-phosphate synthase enzyme YjbQ [Halanaerobium polyolivorans]MCC3145836.1 secondary thiamine-phosphate synthase enzyme YjbQ [Halanaerobium polyolivorans]RQD75357.1 MAG: YjbQ family protein [Halanaerobium sp. MSAO_Bac5]
MLKELSIESKERVEFIDISYKIKKIVENSGVESGILQIHIPHTTAAVTINENADPSVKSDIKMELNKIVPFEDNYDHLEGNSAAHIKSSLIGVDQNLIIYNHQLKLGKWQGIYFCEFDGPRRRKIIVTIVKNN